jgi:hypothetical protein
MVKNEFKQTALSVAELAGVILVLYGLYVAVGLERVAGIWLAMLGVLTVRIAGAFTNEFVLHRALGGHRVAEFIEPESLLLDPSTPLSVLMHKPKNISGQLIFPDANMVDHSLIGLADVRTSAKFPANEWSAHSVAEITRPCDEDLKISPEADAETALMKMESLGLKEMLVVKGNRLLGVLRRNTLLKQLQESFAMNQPVAHV